MTAAACASGTGFRAEADMLDYLARSPLFAHRMNPLFEIPCTAGVPDIVFIQFDEKGLAERAPRTALTDLTELRVMMAVAGGRGRALRPWVADDVASHVHLTSTYLRRSVLPRLVAGGHLERVGKQWMPMYRYRSLAKRIVTVEAKLRDWRGAIAQASRHRGVADAAWVAIDEAAARAALGNQHWFTTYGIGLATVSLDGVVRAVIDPRSRRCVNAERELLAERAAGLHLAGRVSGDIHPVFGQTLLATTGVDPRLAGV
ncbi:hypothetical protein AB0L57_19820 [Nocardia sp. NPDC052254]|uniref:hypothetical protein n=1 Tax=Nocardia sp. NPDC052254 TaxID=3155681 RepID=UPI0034181062